MDKTIAINAGSSSLKWKLYGMPEEKILARGLVERIGSENAVFTIVPSKGEVYKETLPILDHEVAVLKLLECLIQLQIIEDMNEITGVGHRVVAGGEIFKESVLIDDEVIEQIESLIELAPLHNGANAIGIRAFKHILPDIVSVAVFDTSFHQTMPEVNYLYSLPMKYYRKHTARKYGAHGTSHRYVANRAAQILGQPLEDLKVVTAHLGNGSSVTAIKEGKSLDTSMGFTPLTGVTMGTRSGDIDTSLVMYLMKKEGIEDIDEMLRILNNESGLLGISEYSNDMRDLIEASEAGSHQAKLALRIFEDRIIKYIGQYATIMGGIDVLVFTAGVGENDIFRRKNIVDGLSVFGAKIDKEANKIRGGEQIISAEDSKVKVLVVPTDEELMIARDVEHFIQLKKQQEHE